MDGFALVKRLRKLPQYMNVPMISMSGFPVYDDRQRALDAGFDQHLSKPLNLSTLVDTIGALLGKATAAQ